MPQNATNAKLPSLALCSFIRLLPNNAMPQISAGTYALCPFKTLTNTLHKYVVLTSHCPKIVNFSIMSKHPILDDNSNTCCVYSDVAALA